MRVKCEQVIDVVLGPGQDEDITLANLDADLMDLAMSWGVLVSSSVTDTSPTAGKEQQFYSSAPESWPVSAGALGDTAD